MPKEGEAVTFSEFSRSWLSTWAIVRLKASGYRGGLSRRLHLVPEFGELTSTLVHRIPGMAGKGNEYSVHVLRKDVASC